MAQAKYKIGMLVKVKLQGDEVVPSLVYQEIEGIVTTATGFSYLVGSDQRVVNEEEILAAFIPIVRVKRKRKPKAEVFVPEESPAQ